MLRPKRYWIRPGWLTLADCALECLSEIGVTEVLEVREKLGCLRISVRSELSTADAAARVVRQSSELSALICDVCGDAGQLRSTGWLRTRCDAHAGLSDPEISCPMVAVSPRLTPARIGELLRNHERFETMLDALKKR
jgi:hypothetical protein